MEVEVGTSNVEMKSNNDDKFIDRSKVRILVCDNDDDKGCLDVVSLLCNCSYQVTAVRSPRQVIDALNAEGPNIDIILAEVDLPMKKGLKLLKYIMRDKELQRIPVIMMSTQDEVSLVVKCLRLGAADFLVKPLRSNELLNLWTHMWRRRRMLGFAEKNIMTYDFDLVASDPSDANTNSTIQLSDDTDDESQKSTYPEMSMSVQQDEQGQHPLRRTNKATVEPLPMGNFDCRPSVPGISDSRTGQCVSFPRKTELRIGECSAFFTYVKSNTVKNNCQSIADVDANLLTKNNSQVVVVVDIEGDASQRPRVEDNSETSHDHVHNGNLRYGNGDTWENSSYGGDLPSSIGVPKSTSVERSYTPPVSTEFTPRGVSELSPLDKPPKSVQSKLVPSSAAPPFVPNKSNNKGSSQPRNGAPFDVSGLAGQGPYPYYMSGMVNQVLMPPAHMYQKDLQGHGASSMMLHHNHLPHYPSHISGMAPFNYYPMGMCGPSYGNSPSVEANVSKVDRREAALIKFRRKRKERCFDKKIRYVNRKKLAERRPRVRGQFVRKMNGITFDLNGDPSPADLDEEDEYEDDPTSRGSSPEDDAS